MLRDGPDSAPVAEATTEVLGESSEVFVAGAAREILRERREGTSEGVS